MHAASSRDHMMSDETPSSDFPVVRGATSEADVAFFIDMPAFRKPARINVFNHKSLVANRLIWRRCWCWWLGCFIWLAVLVMAVSPWCEADCLLSAEPQSLLLEGEMSPSGMGICAPSGWSSVSADAAGDA